MPSARGHQLAGTGSTAIYFYAHLATVAFPPITDLGIYLTVLDAGTLPPSLN